MTEIIVECPHCGCQIEIIEINCQIFRHGIYKATGQQMDPHAPKAVCDEAVETASIHGCGKPFRLVKENDVWKAVVCEYI